MICMETDYFMNFSNLNSNPQKTSLISAEDTVEYPHFETMSNILQNVEDLFMLDDQTCSNSSTTRFDEYTNVDRTLVECISPTPIGPSHAVRVVEEVPLTQVATRGHDTPAALLDCLRPLLLERQGISQRMEQEEPRKLKRQSDFAFPNQNFHPQKSRKVVLDRDEAEEEENDDDELERSNSACSFSSSQCHSTLDREKNGPVRIRAHQSTQWNERYRELVQYQKQYGHCVVPYHYKENAKLALWVKRQRHQYKLKKEGQHSTMSDDREVALESLGFVWDSHKAVWEERINELIAYREKYGHCNVPAKFAENSQLAIWVKCQRRQYKLFCAGERSNMSESRIERLSAVGFVWDPRSQF